MTSVLPCSHGPIPNTTVSFLNGLIEIALTFSDANIGSGKPFSHSHSISSVAILTLSKSQSMSP